MLVLGRYANQEVDIAVSPEDLAKFAATGEPLKIRLVVIAIRPEAEQVKLGFEAPREVQITRPFMRCDNPKTTQEHGHE